MTGIPGALTIVVILSLMFTGIICGALINSDFEILDDPSRNTGFETPAYWDIVHYAAVKEIFKPNVELNQESYINWPNDVIINGIEPVSGEYFVILSTGDFAVDSSTDISVLSQEVTTYQGQAISFDYFFGTLDFSPYYDYASVRLVSPEDPNDAIDLLMVGLDTEMNQGHENYYLTVDVGTYGSTEGWQHFEYRFTEETAGNYILEAAVYDIADNIYRSYIALDNINICVAPEYGDLNYDCFVDMLDFSLLAEDWMCDCSDPDNLPDPNDCAWELDRMGNVITNYAGDINNDNAVNHTDLDMLSGQWLSGEK